MAFRRFTADDDELLVLLRPEMERLTALDPKHRAPSRVSWDVQRDKDLPCANYLIARFHCGWPALVERCGCTPARRYVRADGTMSGGAVPLGLADEIERGLAEGRIEHATWMDRFRAVLHALPTPRVETVMGRSVAGEPVVIRREYWMLR